VPLIDASTVAIALPTLVLTSLIIVAAGKSRCLPWQCAEQNQLASESRTPDRVRIFKTLAGEAIIYRQYLKSIAVGVAFGVLVVIALFCADCFDGGFTAHWGGGIGMQEKNAFVAIDNQVDMMCRVNNIEMHRAAVKAKCWQGYALILLNYRLAAVVEILTGSMLATLIASIIRRGLQPNFSKQLQVLAAAVVVGFALTASRVGYDYQFNNVNQDGVWPDAIWPAMDLSIKCLIFALLAIRLIAEVKKTVECAKTTCGIRVSESMLGAGSDSPKTQ
jgi:hypothetical protein